MIYFVETEAGGLIKIGFSLHPLRRFRQLQTAHPMKLTLLGVIDGTSEDERALHARFSDLRWHGEWFVGHARLSAHVRGLVAKRGIEPPPMTARAKAGAARKPRPVKAWGQSRFAEVEKVRRALRSGIPASLLAKEGRVSRRRLDRAHTDEWNPRFRTVAALARAVDRICDRIKG